MNKVEMARKIDLAAHPLFLRLKELHGFTELAPEDLEAFLAKPGFGAILFIEDPNRMKETLDELVIAPELLKAYPMVVNRGVLVAERARLVANRYGFRKWPAMVLTRDGKYLGVLAGLMEWGDAERAMAEVMASEPSRPPTVGIPVNRIN